VPGAVAARALIPQAQSRVTLAVDTGSPAPVAAALKSGNLFSPYLTLQLHYELAGEGVIATRLVLEKL
jgi:hypothetical protein